MGNATHTIVRELALIVAAATGYSACEHRTREADHAQIRFDAGAAIAEGGVPKPHITTIPMRGVVAVTLPPDAVCRHATGDAARGAAGECSRDEDCVERAYGRCNLIQTRNTCRYDDCVADSECERIEAGTICVCAAGNEPNRCMKGNCRSDRDCAPGDRCVEHRCQR